MPSAASTLKVDGLAKREEAATAENAIMISVIVSRGPVG